MRVYVCTRMRVCVCCISKWRLPVLQLLCPGGQRIHRFHQAVREVPWYPPAYHTVSKSDMHRQSTRSVSLTNQKRKRNYVGTVPAKAKTKLYVAVTSQNFIVVRRATTYHTVVSALGTNLSEPVETMTGQVRLWGDHTKTAAICRNTNFPCPPRVYSEQKHLSITHLTPSRVLLRRASDVTSPTV